MSPASPRPANQSRRAGERATCESACTSRSRRDERPTREQLDQPRARVKIEPIGDRQIKMTFANAADATKLTLEQIRKFGDLKEESRNGAVINLGIRADMIDELRDKAVGQARET